MVFLINDLFDAVLAGCEIIVANKKKIVRMTPDFSYFIFICKPKEPGYYKTNIGQNVELAYIPVFIKKQS